MIRAVWEVRSTSIHICTPTLKNILLLSCQKSLQTQGANALIQMLSTRLQDQRWCISCIRLSAFLGAQKCCSFLKRRVLIVAKAYRHLHLRSREIKPWAVRTHPPSAAAYHVLSSLGVVQQCTTSTKHQAPCWDSDHSSWYMPGCLQGLSASKVLAFS